jgi:TonB family protein
MIIRSPVVAALLSAWFAACSQTPAPQGASPAVPASTPAEATAMAPAAPPAATGAPATASAAEPASSRPPPAPGAVGVPPASASAWNNAQSDGKPPAADRGLNDYRAIIQNNRDRFRACYEASLGAHPGLKGTAVLRFVLTPDGTVKEAALDKTSDLVEPELEKCMVRALKALSFPPSKRGMESTVRYPFTFTPKGSEKR